MAYGDFLISFRYISVFSAFAFWFRQSGMHVGRQTIPLQQQEHRKHAKHWYIYIYIEMLYQSPHSWWKHDKQLLCLQCSLHVFGCNTYFLYIVPTTHKPHIYIPISYTILCKPIYRTQKYASAKHASSSAIFRSHSMPKSSARVTSFPTTTTFS